MNLAIWPWLDLRIVPCGHAVQGGWCERPTPLAAAYCPDHHQDGLVARLRFWWRTRRYP